MAIKLYNEALQMRKDLGLTAAAADTLGNMAIVCDFQVSTQCLYRNRVGLLLLFSLLLVLLLLLMLMLLMLLFTFDFPHVAI